MGRTLLRQDAQMRQSVVFDDTIAAGSTLETNSTDLETDLNAIRSQIKRLFLADVAGDWWRDVDTIGGSKRGIAALATDLRDIETKKLLGRVCLLTDISVTAAQNWEILSVAGSEAPTRPAAVALTVEGAVVAQSALSGAGFNVHELIEIGGTEALHPKNLCTVRDATTGQAIQSSGRDVFALLQYESTGVDGGAFDDVSEGNRVKLSFVRPTAGFDDLEACPVGDIAGKSINYAYVDRRWLDNIPEQHFLTDMFVDQIASVDVTLNNAIDNQSGPASQTDRHIEWRITDDYELRFQTSDGGVNILKIAPAAAGDEVELNVTTLDVNNAATADFANGATFDSTGTAISVGAAAGEITSAGALLVQSAGGNDARVLGGRELFLDDGNQAGSTWAQTDGIKLSETTDEWDAFETAFGEVSLLNAIVQAQSSAAHDKTSAVVTTNIAANVNVTGAGGSPNIDAQLLDYHLVNFLSDVNVYLNGQLLRNGADQDANFDVYPGTDQETGDLKFEFALKASPGNPDVITMERFGG